MPPEEPGQLTVLDLAFDGEALRCGITRIHAPLKEWLAVSWASREPPTGYLPVAEGVVYVRAHSRLDRTSSSGIVDHLGALEYGWRERVQGYGLMLVLILPSGYSLAGSDPGIEAAKVAADGRIAVYTMVGLGGEGRAAARWTLSPLASDPAGAVEALNRRAYSAEAGYARPGYAFIAEPESRASQTATSVFVCYSHRDADYMKPLLDYLSGLKEEGITFWTDQHLIAGDLWDTEIRRQVEQADIVLALVSQAFLNSDYIRNVEIARALERRAASGLRIMPIIVSPSDWQSVSWLAKTEVLPKNAAGGDTLSAKGAHERDALFLTVLKQLRDAAKKIRRPSIGGSHT
jgi:hypothetical protein